MPTISTNSFIKNPVDYLNKAARQSGGLLIKTDAGDVVVMNVNKYRSLLETAYINSIPGLADDIIEGMKTPLDQCVELDWKNEL